MNYAIQTLEDEKAIIEKCLSKWDKDHYPQAYADRNRKIKEINEALEILKSKEI
tara:strand:- start:576 stop:737 length:162 start_codon:yes stop_codon:yes gene_type:complete